MTEPDELILLCTAGIPLDVPELYQFGLAGLSRRFAFIAPSRARGNRQEGPGKVWANMLKCLSRSTAETETFRAL